MQLISHQLLERVSKSISTRCLYSLRWVCAIRGVHVCASCLENTPIHPFLHKSFCDPLPPSRPPPQLLSAQPGSVCRKQLPPMSAHLLISRCILGMEQCVSHVVRPTVCDVPLQSSRSAWFARFFIFFYPNLTNHGLILDSATTSSTWELI